jgi:hypothetical protein
MVEEKRSLSRDKSPTYEKLYKNAYEKEKRL